jgi:hypothetical protein
MVKTIGFGNWKIKWCEKIAEKYKDAANVKKYNSRRSIYDGTFYWNEIMKCNHAYRDTLVWMLNPTPPVVSVRGRKRKISPPSEEGREEE